MGIELKQELDTTKNDKFNIKLDKHPIQVQNKLYVARMRLEYSVEYIKYLKLFTNFKK